MSAQFRLARAADDFDRLLRGQDASDLRDRYADFEDLATLTHRVAALPRPEASPEFVTGLRTRLLEAADTLLVPAGPVPARRVGRSRRERAAGLAAALAILLGGTAGVAAASGGALPGQPLYPVKRGWEQVEVALAAGDAARGVEYLEQADSRLGELHSLLTTSGGMDHVERTATVTTTLHDFVRSSSDGADLLLAHYRTAGDSADVVRIHRFVTRGLAALETLRTLAPPESHDQLVRAAETLVDLDAAARRLCPGCANGTAALPPGLSPTSSLSLTALLETPAADAEQQLLAERAVRRRTAQLARRHRLQQLVSTAERAARRPAAGVGGTPATPTSGSGEPRSGSGALTGTSQDVVGGLVHGVTGATSGLAGPHSVSDTVGSTTDTLDTLTGTRLGSSVDSQLKPVTGGADRLLQGITDGTTQGLPGLTGQ